MSASLLRGDARHLPLADNSVDLVVTSPPYMGLRSYRDGGEHMERQIGDEATPTEFLRALWAVMDECHRVLKPHGNVFWNLGDRRAGSGGHNNGGIAKPDPKRPAWDDDVSAMAATRRQAPDRYTKITEFAERKSLMGLPWSFALGCSRPNVYRSPFDESRPDPLYPDSIIVPREHPRWVVRAEIVWHKTSPMPESVPDRVHLRHELIFHLSKNPEHYASIDEIREPYKPGTPERYAAGYGDRSGTNDARVGVGYDLGGDQWETNPAGRAPGSVWELGPEPLAVPDWLDAQHFAAFPSEIPRRCILGWTPPGYCLECDEPRRPQRGTTCDACGELRPPQAKSCPACGHVRDWKEGRVQNAAMGANDWSTPGHGTPRHPGNHQSRTVHTGYVCACDEPTAPTRPAVVLDPFSGTGTTALTARALGRIGIGVDLSSDYLRLAKWRVFDPGQSARVLRKTNQAAQGVLL